MTRSEAERPDHLRNGKHLEPPLVTDPTTGTKRKMTPDELEIWEGEVKRDGPEEAVKWIELALEQARSIGEI